MLDWSCAELLTRQASGELSAVAIARRCLDAIAVLDPQVKAFLQVDADAVLAQADAVDGKRRAGAPLGPLAGVPVAIKDVLCVRGQRTTCASRILENFTPPYDATVVAKLRAADAILLGKTNCDEFAMGSTNENSGYFPTRNPWDLARSPGGSSGGSAAAVASGMVPLALGTDTGGSVRQPASWCGIVGLKPSYGRVSRFGLVAYGSSLDQVGPMARSVADVAALFAAVAGHDPRDSTSAPVPLPDDAAQVDAPVRPLVLGVPREYFSGGLDAEVESAIRAALDVYRDLGAEIREVSLPNVKYGVAAYYVVATAEASSNLARYDGVHYGHRAKDPRDLADLVCRSRGEGFGPEVKRRIMLGTYVLSSGYIDAYYLQALKVRRLVKRDFDEAFATCDALVGPAAPTPAEKLGAHADDPLAVYLADVYTVGANLAGIPGLSLPCGFTRAGLPIGMQLLAAPYAEPKLLRIARTYECTADWSLRRPSLAAGA